MTVTVMMLLRRKIRYNNLFFLALGICLIIVPCAEGSVEEGCYSVQVASYRNIDGAMSLITLLKKQGYNPFPRTVEIPGKGEWKRVCVGRYRTREEALRAGETLRERGIINHFLIVQVALETRVSVPNEKTAAKKPVIETGTNTGADADADATIKITADTITRTHADTGIAPGTRMTISPLPPVLLRKKISAAPASPESEAVTGKTAKADPSPRGTVKGMAQDLRTGALEDFASGRYEEALRKFRKVVVTGKGKDETILRRMADCHYFLGEEGDTEHTSKAIDSYREIIRAYPGNNPENARVTYRLADGYRRLNLQYEALAEFKNSYLNYPESEYTPESLYLMASITYEAKRFDEAVELFKEYIKRFPKGTHIKEAYFRVGDCYSRMRQFHDADVWYNNALKRWPVLEEVPRDALLRLGEYRFQIGRYDDAAEILLTYLNLFPEGDHAKNALYTVARSYEQTDRIPSALKIFSLVIERYPGSSEAKESALAMANMGVERPGIPVPEHIFAGMDCYRDPIEAYDEMAGTFSDPKMREEAMSRKVSALMKGGRYREAFDAGCLLLTIFPKGKHRKAGKEQLIVAAGNLIDGHYTKGDYIAVVDLYFNLDKDVLFEKGGFEMLSQIGRSLKEMDLLDEAAEFFEKMALAVKDDPKSRILSVEMARIDYERGRYSDAKQRLQAVIEKWPEIDNGTTMTARRVMGDIAYAEESYKKAAGYYSVVLGSGKDPAAEMTVRKRYADVLREMGMYASALVNYRRVVTGCDDTVGCCPLPVVMNSYEGLGDCLYRKGQYRQAIRMYLQSLDGIPAEERNRWTIADIGRGYAHLGGTSVPGEQPISLQTEADDPFWSRVMDYYRADSDWTDKYGPYIRDS